MLRRLARPVARRSGAGAAQAPNRARVRRAQAGRRRVVPGGQGGGGQRRQAPPGRHGREQDRALRGIREADELRRRRQLRHLHRRDNRRKGAAEPQDGRRESLPEEETGVVEADLPDDRREQGELRQGRRPTAAPVEEMTEQSLACTFEG